MHWNEQGFSELYKVKYNLKIQKTEYIVQIRKELR